MQLPDSLLALLLFSIPPLAHAAEAKLQWPHNLPKDTKYFPEDEMHVKRGIDIHKRLQKEKPIGVKKMSTDEGEMFMLDNWIFASDSTSRLGKREAKEENNVTIQALSPLRPHVESHMFDPFLRFAPRNALFARDFKCPEGTNSCSSIGAANNCCGTGSYCINVPDTGDGPVGCCPQGQTCAGAVTCDVARGYSSCPGSDNGGCCLPGYSCQGVGCVIAGTSITYVRPSTSATPSPSSSTAIVVVPTMPSSTSPTPRPSSYMCSSGWFSCAANLGGGCCQNGRTCATGASCIGEDTSSLLSTQAPSAPVRPTSNSAVTSQAPTITSDPAISMCPTGFYVCSAYYPSGCCRVGQDCQTIGSCAPIPSATVVNSNGVTIVAGGSGAGFATTASAPSGSCPQNWYSCAASVGGNCCPNGFACGEQCTATASDNASVTAKATPSTASRFSSISIYVMISGALGAFIGMIFL